MTTSEHQHNQPVAVVTGASRGLGLALTEGLVARGWHVIGDARSGRDLRNALRPLGSSATAVVGSVADTGHRMALEAAVGHRGRLDLLVHNAGSLGAHPLPLLENYPIGTLRELFESAVAAPLALTQRLLPHLRGAGGEVWAVTSDAAREAYPGWGGYGCVKAALEQLLHVWAAEEPGVRWRRIDPGDLQTRMHQEAFPGQDISDRPLPATVVPRLLGLLGRPTGRYRADDLATA